MKRDIELIKVETRRLEVLGVILRNIGQSKGLGRKRVYQNNRAKMRAYRERQSWKPLAEIMQSKKVTDVQKVAKKRPVSL